MNKGTKYTNDTRDEIILNFRDRLSLLQEKKLHKQNQTHTHSQYKLFTSEKKHNTTCFL